MLNTRKYFITGAFVAGAMLLLIAAMFCLGLADEFAERVYLATTFSESVQGLTKGSAVKYKGVPIGQVDKISILPEERIIRVDMSIDPKTFPTMSADEVEDFCRNAVKSGLSCRLDLAGITGMRYIEMDYVEKDKQRKTPLPEISEPDVPCHFPSHTGPSCSSTD